MQTYMDELSGVVQEISMEEDLRQFNRIGWPFFLLQWFCKTFNTGLNSWMRRVNCYHYLPMQIPFSSSAGAYVMKEGRLSDPRGPW